MNEYGEVTSSLRQWFRTVYITYNRDVAVLITGGKNVAQDTTIDSTPTDRLFLNNLASVLPSAARCERCSGDAYGKAS